jgi:hypothetical protein
MTDDIKRRIERLLEEPDDLPGRRESLVRARLSATLSEGLAGSAAASEVDAGDSASIAAFIDGRLTDTERDKYAPMLAQNHGLRADVESAAALVDAIASSPSKLPAGLLARASAQLAPAAPRPAASPSRSRWTLFARMPRQRVAWAMAAALALIVIAPAALMVGGRIDGPHPHIGGEPELSVAPGPDDDDSAPPSCDDKAKAAKEEMSKSGLPEPSRLPEPKEAVSPASSPKDALSANPKDPCETPVSHEDGSTDK